MSPKKSTKTKSKKAPRSVRRDNEHKNMGIMLGDNDEFPLDVLPLVEADGAPYRLNPETEEEREKRLAKRKALTLKAFQTTYENRRRKAS